LRAFLETVRLELRRFVRAKAAAMLLVASLAWMVAMPALVKSDGTAQGAREIYLHYSLGGVFALCCVTLSASAAASLAREREERRLALSVVRPQARATLALGRIVALTLAGSVVLAAAALAAGAVTGFSRSCAHVLSPVLPSPRAEAEEMYRHYMADPETPPEVKKAKKSLVMRILTQRAVDNYQSIAPGETAQWLFAPHPGWREDYRVRMRFTNDFDIRDDVRGAFVFGGFSGAVSNITQAVATIPLARDGEAPVTGVLAFRNDGEHALMLRPRRDINLLVRADAFGWNLLRAYAQLVSMLAALLAFATFLGSGLGRAVAVFTCLAVLFVSAVSDDVIAQYPDPLESDRTDRIGLAITRAVSSASQSVASLSPLSALSQDACVETRETLFALLRNLVGLPLLFALLSGLAIAKKPSA